MTRIFFKTVRHFFPEMRGWLKEIKEPRKKKGQIEYMLPEMIWTGLFLFLFKLGARRQVNFKLNTVKMIENLGLLCKKAIRKVTHDGNLAYFLKILATGELAELRRKMILRLFRMRSLEKFRLFGRYLVSVDGSGILSFDKPHCEHCLTKEKDGKIYCWQHSAVDAKLLGYNGLALSLGTEFIENPNQETKPQDCETKAFYRLAPKLKKDFPQLPICLLLDGLYASQEVFDICDKNHWDYIITFKEGSMPATFAEFITLRNLSKENYAKISRPGIEQEFRWVNGIEYEGHSLNVLECKEVREERNKAGEIVKTEKRFVWLTSFSINKSNFEKIASKGGRLRWKTENEGFNMQKNGGYNLEHAYCLDEKAIKNFYLLLQIAHNINQLMEFGNLLKGEVQQLYGSIKNFTSALLEAFRTSVMDAAELLAIETTAFQIRLRGPT